MKNIYHFLERPGEKLERNYYQYPIFFVNFHPARILEEIKQYTKISLWEINGEFPYAIS